jgi:peptidoglycan/LPS O-acetylase OafA/YrhL
MRRIAVALLALASAATMGLGVVNEHGSWDVAVAVAEAVFAVVAGLLAGAVLLAAVTIGRAIVRRTTRIRPGRDAVTIALLAGLIVTFPIRSDWAHDGYAQDGHLPLAELVRVAVEPGAQPEWRYEWASDD